MNSKEKSKNPFLIRFRELRKDETKIAIISALEWFGSLNLTKLSFLISKSTNATHHAIKGLLKDELIIIDTKKTAENRGKYYCLTSKIKDELEIFKGNYKERNKEITEEIEDLVKMNEEELREAFANSLKVHSNIENLELILNLNQLLQNVQSMIINEFNSGVSKILENMKNKKFDINDLPISALGMYNEKIKVGKFSHIVELYNIIRTFVYEIRRLNDKFVKEIRDEQIQKDRIAEQVIFLFNGGIGKILEEG